MARAARVGATCALVVNLALLRVVAACGDSETAGALADGGGEEASTTSDALAPLAPACAESACPTAIVKDLGCPLSVDAVNVPRWCKLSGNGVVTWAEPAPGRGNECDGLFTYHVATLTDAGLAYYYNNRLDLVLITTWAGNQEESICGSVLVPTECLPAGAKFTGWTGVCYAADAGRRDASDAAAADGG
jgi:hypothetical protein